jgi:hypothetical protein
MNPFLTCLRFVLQKCGLTLVLLASIAGAGCDGTDPAIESWSAPATAGVPACGQAGALPLAIAQYPHHGDTVIATHIDLHALDVTKYAALGVRVTTEDGVDYHPAGEAFAVGADLRALPAGGCFDRALANLNPGKTYQVCLNGLNSDFTTTGPFACRTLKTAARQAETALLVTNSKTRSIQSTISSWVSKVKSRNQGLTIHEVTIADGASVEALWNAIHQEYLGSNLTTVILGSPGLPLPTVSDMGTPRPYSGVYTTQTRGFHADDGFANPSNDLFEVTIASWRTIDVATLKRYLTRVLDHYAGRVTFSKRLLVANAMIPTDLHRGESDFLDARYGASNHDYVGGITAYFDEAQGTAWRARFSSLLGSKSYDLMLLDAHGDPVSHYPCDGAGCVDTQLIDAANPRVKLTVAASCAIGNTAPALSMMSAYVFDGRSLGGLASEITVFADDDELNRIKAALEAATPVGRAGRRYGFTAYGDPFLTL